MALLELTSPAAPGVDWQRVTAEGVERQLATLKPGARVAVAVGSRGIADLLAVVRGVVETLRSRGHRPFLVPAMGSHGGATVEGQIALLAGYGITERTLRVPIRASLEVRTIGRTDRGLPLLWSVEAAQADAVILVNRIKPHTDFRGAIGSGLQKMLVVGLGKHAGAVNFHAASSRFGYEQVLRDSAAVLLRMVPIVCGVAIVENARHETVRIDILPRHEIVRAEPGLCAAAASCMARLPFADVDLLIVDWMGKNLSGTGMDPAIIGRMIHGYSLAGDAGQPPPRIRRLFVRDLTPESRGNAIGIGLADFTTTRLVKAMDRQITTINALTALSLQGAKVPLHFDTDGEVLARLWPTLALPNPAKARVARIRNTLSLERVLVSPALLAQIRKQPGFRVLREPQPMAFDGDGNLEPMTTSG